LNGAATSLAPPVTYTVKIGTNIYSDSVIAFYNTTDTTYYNQTDISFSKYYNEFDVSDPTYTNHILSFSTTVDSADATFESTYVTRNGTPGNTGATVILNLELYTGAEVFYFDSATTGMGYVEAPTTGVTTKVVTVATDSNGANAYYIDTVERDQITFAASTTYVFDQSDSSNAGHQIVFGTTADDTQNIYQPSDGVTIMGEPGQPGAYTKLVLPSTFTGTLYYYCYSHTGMGYSTSSSYFDQEVSVTVSNGLFYLDNVQTPYFHFEANTIYKFDQSDSSNTGNQIVFGSTYDDTTTIDSGVTTVGTPGQSGAYTKLQLTSSYVGPIYYFSYNNTGVGSGPQYHLVFAQTVGYWMTNTLSTHTGYTDVNNQYSILYKMNNTTYLKYGNTYRFKYYVSSTKYIIWEQSNSFLNSSTVTGFNKITNVGINEGTAPNNFGGITVTASANANLSQYDLTPDHNSVWFAIGQKRYITGLASIALDFTVGNHVELYAYY
jgi:hypothetical protein